jgi:hypothetical protein
MCAVDLCKDGIGVLGPRKGPRGLVVAVEVFRDGGHQRGHTLEGPAPNALPGNLREPPLHQVQPRAARWREVKMDPRMAWEPLH